MGIYGESSGVTTANCQQRLAGLIAAHSPVPHGNHWRCSYPCSWSYGTQADHAEHVADVLQAEFDFLPKGELHRETKTRRMEVNGGPELVQVSRLATDWKR